MKQIEYFVCYGCDTNIAVTSNGIIDTYNNLVKNGWCVAECCGATVCTDCTFISLNTGEHVCRICAKGKKKLKLKSTGWYNCICSCVVL